MEKPKYFRANDEGLSYVVLHNFQQYFSHIVAISFIGGGNREYLLKIRPAAGHRKTCVASSAPPHERDSTHNLSGDRHWLHR